MNPTEHPPTEYAWLRTREFEGTFPGEPMIGTWPINYNRILKFYGHLPEPVWKGAWPPPDLPSKHDDAKELTPVRYYRRLFSFDDCVHATTDQMFVSLTLAVTSDWESAIDGRLDFDQKSKEVLGLHTLNGVMPAFAPIPSPLDIDLANTLLFANSWGTSWGYYGHGSVTRQFVKENLYGAWAADLGGNFPSVESDGQTTLTWRVYQARNREYFATEIIDPDLGKPVAWSFFSTFNSQMIVDEFFVMPEFRGKGLGRKLLNSIQVHSMSRNAIPFFIVPFADIDTHEKYDFIVEWFSQVGLSSRNSRYRFAGLEFSAFPEHERTEYPWIPPKPAYCLDAGVEPSRIGDIEQIASSQQETLSVSDDFRDSAIRVMKAHNGAFERLAK